MDGYRALLAGLFSHQWNTVLHSPGYQCGTSINMNATQSRKSRSAILFYTGVTTTITEGTFPLAFPQSAGEEGGTATSTSALCSWDILLPLHQESSILPLSCRVNYLYRPCCQPRYSIPDSDFFSLFSNKTPNDTGAWIIIGLWDKQLGYPSAERWLQALCSLKQALTRVRVPCTPCPASIRMFWSKINWSHHLLCCKCLF